MSIWNQILIFIFRNSLIPRKLRALHKPHTSLRPRIFACILLGISPASDCGLPTFRNPLSVPSSRAGCKVLLHTLHPVLEDGTDRGLDVKYYFILYIQPLKMELIEGSETSANHNRTPGKYPKEYIQDSKHGESLKPRIFIWKFYPT